VSEESIIPKTIIGPVPVYQGQGEWITEMQEVIRIKDPDELEEALCTEAMKLANEGCLTLHCFIVNIEWLDIKASPPEWLEYRNAILGGDQIIYETHDDKVHEIKDDRPRFPRDYIGTGIPIFAFMGVPVYLTTLNRGKKAVLAIP